MSRDKQFNQYIREVKSFNNRAALEFAFPSTRAGASRVDKGSYILTDDRAFSRSNILGWTDSSYQDMVRIFQKPDKYDY